MNKQLKLDDEARALVRTLAATLNRLAEDQQLPIWHGHFEMSVLDADRVWFSFHPTYYYLDDPTMGKDDESTVSESEQLPAASR